tara:strand:+ start:283 stop:756 length:474 start_codon:yes stop_codon:yes gene_type:complete
MFEKKLFNFLFIFIIFLFDRVSKFFIIKLADPLGELNISITSFLNFNLIWNEGIAFGLFSFDQKVYYNSLTIIISFITLILVWFMLNSKGLERIGFSMIIGGSLGNIFDRLYYSSVPDFIDFNLNNFHWFIFNVADIFICLGVILLITLEIFSKKKI